VSNLLFLVAAAGISVLGSIVLWLRARKPVTLESSVDSFAREMRALAPDGEQRGGRQQGGGDAARRRAPEPRSVRERRPEEG
jgi:hypothetical protein